MSSSPSVWIQISVECPRGLAEHIQHHLFQVGASGCEEGYRPGETPPPRQPWDQGPSAPTPSHRVIHAWFETDNGAPIVCQLEKALNRNTKDVLISWAPYIPVDWEAKFKAQHQAICISNRLSIAPPWDFTDNSIIIEPGIGFGTGSHPTTLQALRALDKYADTCKTALDIGCGSGILALAACKLGLSATGFDIEAGAVKSAQRHAEINGLNVHFSTRPLHEWKGPYDIVLANLHAELLIENHKKLIDLTAKILITAGIMYDKANRVKVLFDGHFSEVEWHDDGEWVSLVCIGRKES